MKAFSKIVIGLVTGLVALTLVAYSTLAPKGTGDAEVVTIGVITPLTGGVAYWGESSLVGIELAKRDLAAEGLTVDFRIEDGQLDPKVALSAAQKLVNVDKVDALYGEFNPTAIAVSSYVKDMDMLYLYAAAPVSPLAENENIFKTYLDYETSCREVALVARSRGIERMGMLKMGMEFADLCESGLRDVYTDMQVQEYQIGDSDFRTQLTKLKSSDVQAVINVGYQPETLASLRQMRELGMDVMFLGLSETITPDVVDEYAPMLEGAIMFGLPAVDDEFKARLDAVGTVSDYHAAALAYLHMKQLARTLDACGTDTVCARDHLAHAEPDSTVGFRGFTNRVAGFDVRVQEWKGGKLVDIGSAQ